MEGEGGGWWRRKGDGGRSAYKLSSHLYVHLCTQGQKTGGGGGGGGDTHTI